MTPSAFISYSWDSEEHRFWVRRFAETLVSCGVHVHLDLWETRLGMDIYHWMLSSVRESDYVLLVCTPNYAKKANEQRGGVGVETLANRLAECDAEKGRLVKLYARGGLTDAEYDLHAAEIAERRHAAEEGLAETRDFASRLSEMQKARRVVLETFGTGLMGGIYWFPPRLRREVYRLLGLRVEVFADRTVRIEGEFDANLMRLTPEVERWVAGLGEIDARLEERAHADPPKDVQEGIDRIERELAALRRRVCEENATSGCA